MRYVIIGNSAAGIGAVEGIRQKDSQGEIIVITNEPYHTYSRPLISYLLLGKVSEESMKYRPDSFYDDNNCTLLKNTTVTEIDQEAKRVILKDGGSMSYDKLLVATGSSAFTPPFEGLDSVKNRYNFMNIDDVKSFEKSIDEKSRVLIVGAGLIGLKCAEGILDRVQSITVVDLAPRILSSILDEESSKIVQHHLESMGVEFRLSCGVDRFESAGAFIKDGGKVDFDALVVAVGVRPNTVLLKGVAEIEHGIVINEKSETSKPDIYAAGDCTQTADVSSGRQKIMALLPNAYMQGECAGINMAGGGKEFKKALPMNAIGFCGLHIITAGNYEGDEYTESIDGAYKRLFYSKNRLNGYILVGRVDRAGIYTSLIRERTPLDSLDFALICKNPGLMAFGRQDREARLGGI